MAINPFKFWFWTLDNIMKHKISSWVVYIISPEDLRLNPGRVIPKTLKMVLDTSLLNTQQYKVRIKGKVEQSQSRERSSALLYTLV